jgi:hypothetical protein
MTSQRCIQLFLIVLLVTLMSAPNTPLLAAVTISSFEALGQVWQIVVMWTTANESDNVGFNLWRDTSENFVRPTLLNDQQLIPSQCLGCLVGTDYVYTDTAVTPGQLYFYKLESEDINSQLETYAHVTFARASAPSVAPTYPPTHTPVPSPTPTPTAASAPPWAIKQKASGKPAGAELFDSLFKPAHLFDNSRVSIVWHLCAKL